MNTQPTTHYIPTAVDKILVPHYAFQNGKQRIETHLLAAQHSSEPTCIAVIGESRTGKSRLLEAIAEQHPQQRTENGLVIPVLRIRTPSKPTVKGLVETFLRAIGDPLWHKRGSENEKTERLYTLLEEVGTHTVIIDEFQHFYDKVSHKVQHYLSDWLKIFVDRSGLMLVVAGLPSCMAVINQNEQLRGRFIAPIHMPRFDWNDGNQQGEFIACLSAFQEGLDRFDFPALDSDEIAFRFYCATGGLIGYLAKILHQACMNAQLKTTVDQRPVITMEDLSTAYIEAVWSDAITPLMNPFAANFDTTPNSALVDMAKHIGIASPEVTSTRRSRIPVSELPTAAQVLAA
jgi:hypothetical protein